MRREPQIPSLRRAKPPAAGSQSDGEFAIAPARANKLSLKFDL
jgi:hypothetical protein